MAWECVRWAIEQTDLTGPLYTVLLVLAESAHAESGACRVAGAREIAKRSHIANVKRVGAYLRELEALGVLRITRSSGRRSLFDLVGYTGAGIGPTSANDAQPGPESAPLSDTPGPESAPHRGRNRPHTGAGIGPTLPPIDISHREDIHTRVRVREESGVMAEFSQAREWSRTPEGEAYCKRYHVRTDLPGKLRSAWLNATAGAVAMIGG